MNPLRSRRTMLRVPLLEWPRVDARLLDESTRSTLATRLHAIHMYARGTTHKQIVERTGISRQQLSQMLARCQTVAGDGRVFGYRALVKGRRVKPYTRTAKVAHHRGEGCGGCAGALTQLFSLYPDLESFIHGEFLVTKASDKRQENRISIIRLHDKVIGWLKERGLADDQWPLNTQDEGLESLRRYCKTLLYSHERRWLLARSGANAALRSAIGHGVLPVFLPMRPFTAVQFDFHKVDAASVITLTNPSGVDIDVPLARWHIGLLLEERYLLILGAVIALEITPSSDSVLETIECALVPVVQQCCDSALAIGAGRKVFPNQVFERLRGQCFGILRMDNGWSNTAIDVIDNLIDVLGCAVNFGPVRSWWARDEIEKVFGQMTRAALQCSPSTYGAGPLDTRRDHPEQTAQRLHVRLSDLVRSLENVSAAHNTTRTEALAMGAPLESLRKAMENSHSLFIPSPVPFANMTRNAPQTLVGYKTIDVTVRGSIKKGERPFVKIGRWRYTNPRIAADFSLLGSELRAYCSIRDARIVEVVNKSNGEHLGRLVPPARWAETLISFRDRALYFRAGEPMRRAERRDSGCNEWLPPDRSTVAAANTCSASQALVLANRELSRQRCGAEQAMPAPSENHPIEVVSPPTGAPTPGPFDLDRAIEIDHFHLEDGSCTPQRAKQS
jgi:putative transposase